MKITASKNVVVCENLEGGKTSSGILYSNDEKNKPEVGVIYAIGPAGKDGFPVEMKVGDTIVYRRYSDNKIFVEGKEFNFIRFEDVMGVIGK